jgi:hypothetical protein
VTLHPGWIQHNHIQELQNLYIVAFLGLNRYTGYLKMLGFNWTSLISLILFTATLSNARVPNYDSASLEKRQDQGSCVNLPCSPTQCSGSVCQLRSASTLADKNVAHQLSKRAFPNPADIGQYLQEQMNRDDADKLCPVNAGGCVQHRLADLPTDRTSVIGMGNTELTGCTVVAIVSARAVYMVSKA